ncbi:MAG: CRTAC1 family protein [Planctomycetaceae bacterium]
MTRSATSATSAIARSAPRCGGARPPWRWRATVAVLLVPAALAGCRREPAAPAETTAPRPAKAPKAAATAPQAPGAVPQASAPVSRPSPPPLAVAPRFVDVARGAGIDFTYYNDQPSGHWLIAETMGGGAAWLDYDQDGRLDLYLTEGCRLAEGATGDGEHRDRLYRGGRGAGFRDVSAPAGVTDDHYGQGIAVGDYDADGFPDIYLANFGPAVLLHNNGDGTYGDVSAAAGIDFRRWGTSAAFADLDRDGNLDIYACTFLDNSLDNNKACDFSGGRGYCGPGEYAGEQDQVWISRGDGTFAERSQELGFVERDGRGKGLALAIVDLDGDLAPEVYVANDMCPNYLWSSRPTGGSPGIRYEDVAIASGCAVSDDGENEASMGVVAEDLDGDARTDLFLTHFYREKNTLYQNLGQLSFVDVSRRTRIAATSLHNLGFGCVGLDWDRDGRMDLFVATGHVLGPNADPYLMQPQLLHQEPNGTFADVSDAVGGEYFSGRWLGRAAAGADYDDDGDLDIAVSHNTTPVALLRDDTAAPGRFLGLDLRTPSRIPPVGGRVEVRCGGRTVVRPVSSGGSYLTVHDPRLLFALPEGKDDAEVTIRWPSGRVDELRLGPGAYWRIEEGREPRRMP